MIRETVPIVRRNNCVYATYSRLKHVDIDKYTKNKLCTKLALFKRLYRDAGQQNIKFVS